MENAIIVGILLVLVVVALLRVKKHFRGGCCGSGRKTVRIKKKLKGTKAGEKILAIEGLRCENCCARVEDALNRMEGVACRVNLKKKMAIVEYSANVPDERLKEAVEKLGYRVEEIR